ncbi:hypothetical protein EMCG_06134 [[Emmonsia] crescens]|uniref:Uncharacterized protein n=1 Tax=[Emmonsia] crescens TaxID=73230 RepID=A0A0G2J744_9EURO|nr:hypothetical protein EMCG_06134 [Emmonsia crescens UAMH 3008]
MAEEQSNTPPTIQVTSSGQVPSAPGTNEAEADTSAPQEAIGTSDVPDDVLAEYNAALAANPSLQSNAPNPEWEDYETIIAKNPELMAPVLADKTKAFYKSKDKWECGHESPEIPTDIEKESNDGDGEESDILINECRGLCSNCLDPNTNPALKNETVVDGKVIYMSKNKWECGHEGDETRTDIEKDPLDIQSGKPSILINEVRGICPICMDKWHKLESGDRDGGAERGGPSSDPAGIVSSSPPTYDEALETDGQYGQDDEDCLVAQVGLLDLDDGTAKGKGIERPPGVDSTADESASQGRVEDLRYEARTHEARDDVADDDGCYNDNRDDENGYYDKDDTLHYYKDEGESNGDTPKIEVEIDPNAKVTVEVEVKPHVGHLASESEQKTPGQ